MAKKASKKTLIDMSMFCSAADALKKEKNKTVLPISPAIDYRLGGGVIEGSFVLIRGKAKCGKTLTCMEAIVNALKQGRWAMLFDSECRMTASKYFNIDGFDILSHPKFLMMNSESGEESNFIGGETMYSTIIQMMKLPKYRGALFVVDSLSDIVTQELLDDPNVSAQRRDPVPKLNADFCKKVKPYLRTSGAILIGVQHLQVDMSPNGHGALKAVGGDRLEYTSDITLLSKHSPLDLDGNNISAGFEKNGTNIEGLLIRYDLPYNKLLSPFVAKERSEKIQNYYRFGKGCWKSREFIDILAEVGLITYGKSGWITFMTDKYSEKVQGAEKAATIIENDLDYFDGLLKNYYKETYKINYDFIPPEEEDE